MSGRMRMPGSTSAAPNDGSAQRAPRYPSSIAKAVWVMIAQMVLSWIGIALVLMMVPARARSDSPPAGGLTSFEQAMGEESSWVILFAIFCTVLYAMLARQVLAGVHWAQVVVWFLAGANAFFGIVGLITASHLGWSDVPRVLGIPLNIALIVLLAARPSSAHFGQRP